MEGLNRKYLIISNISKRNNAYSLIQTAHAFGFTPIVVGMPNIFPENRIRNLGGFKEGAALKNEKEDSSSSSSSSSSNSGPGGVIGAENIEFSANVKSKEIEVEADLEAEKRYVPSYLSELFETTLFKKSLDEAAEYLKLQGVPIISIEIEESAKSVLNFPFAKSMAFMPGNEGTGLNSKQREVSDGFIYIPQYGQGIESLNVSVATTVILHQYCLWDGI